MIGIINFAMFFIQIYYLGSTDTEVIMQNALSSLPKYHLPQMLRGDFFCVFPNKVERQIPSSMDKSCTINLNFTGVVSIQSFACVYALIKRIVPIMSAMST